VLVAHNDDPTGEVKLMSWIGVGVLSGIQNECKPINIVTQNYKDEKYGDAAAPASTTTTTTTRWRWWHNKDSRLSQFSCTISFIISSTDSNFRMILTDFVVQSLATFVWCN
jgi:hypothetical protein